MTLGLQILLKILSQPSFLHFFPSPECPALMYVKDERHSDSDPNSRHQQTEQSYLKDHWKPKSESRPQSRRQSETTEPDDPRAKPSQTENSWLQEHHKPKNAEEASAPGQKPSTCTCPKRSKSADRPPVKTHVCMCRSKPQPCGGPSQASRLEKATCSVRTSITGSSGAKTSFKSALTDCTKELFDPCACGRIVPTGRGRAIWCPVLPTAGRWIPAHRRAPPPRIRAPAPLLPLARRVPPGRDLGHVVPRAWPVFQRAAGPINVTGAP